MPTPIEREELQRLLREGGTRSSSEVLPPDEYEDETPSPAPSISR